MHYKGTVYFIYVFIFFEMWFCSSRLFSSVCSLTVTVFCRAVIKLVAVYMITEWLSFPIEFHSRVKFALPSHDKTERFSQGVIAGVVFAPHQMLMRHSLQITRFGDFQFTCYQNEISYQNESIIRNENRNELVPELLVRNELSFRYFVNKYREKYGDGMNSFMNESHSGITWTAPKPALIYACQRTRFAVTIVSIQRCCKCVFIFFSVKPWVYV